MNTKQILENIEENGGFDNFRNWDKKEISTWVRANYNCSRYVANNVALELVINFGRRVFPV